MTVKKEISSPPEKGLEKKKYRLRKIEEREAEQHIKEALEDEDCSDERGIDRSDGFRPIGRECR